MKVKSNEVGVCPFCNSEGTLDYGVIRLEDNMCYFPWECRECENEGEEWFSLNFKGHNVYNDDHELIEIEENMIESEEN